MSNKSNDTYHQSPFQGSTCGDCFSRPSLSLSIFFMQVVIARVKILFRHFNLEGFMALLTYKYFLITSQPSSGMPFPLWSSSETSLCLTFFEGHSLNPFYRYRLCWATRTLSFYPRTYLTACGLNFLGREGKGKNKTEKSFLLSLVFT